MSNEVGRWLGEWVWDDNYKFYYFHQMITTKYKRSEVETLHIGRVWLEFDAYSKTDEFE